MDPVRTLVAAVMLMGASWWDLRERRVPNTYWFPFMAMAAAFLAVDMVDGAWYDLLGMMLVAVLAYVFFRMGLWGGADAKGVMILAFLVRENWHGTTTVAVLDALVAGVSLVLLWPVFLFFFNLSKKHVAFPAMLIGRVKPIASAKAQRVWPLQTAQGWRYRTRIGEDLTHIYRDLEAAGRTTVWVTPQLPLLVFIAVGFALVSLFGSPVAWLMVLL